MSASQPALPDLAGRRLGMGLSLGEIAEATKIGVRYLDAIERGQFGKLPGGIYSISYIRQYARALEIDASRLLELYFGTVMGDC
ncbi:MAG: helix-turn-helix domain-containing protein [Acidobacteriia bacterium]|nr:helix-turn-helix domain-containing protein [Terriglobia bacterium]